MKGIQPIVALAFKAVALGMGVACLVLVALRASSLEVYVVLLSIGLFALAVASVIRVKD